ncbi:cytochrome c oxidase subunit II [Stakelama sp. CBK3Z-3]|uniref:Cytochrome c oxidase subunit 2 n=1 Tax=Stakelama flava TaxID=2860338 RepID=A0ABS6XLH3_9SPHN|nr:cytochrome c oxidase subunit II [Stakelama flava]MBW4331070.1 cytochrome c oxidase subunit II [Stakelama flava]
MRITGLKTIVFAAGLALAGVGGTVHAQEAPQPQGGTANAQMQAQAGNDTVTAAAALPDPTLNPDGSQKITASAGIGHPTDGVFGLQEQVTDTGIEAHNFHNHILMPIITAISVFVLILLLIVVVRFRRSANPEPSRTSHNTFIEVVWTVVPVLILVFIAVPSIRLLAHQYKPAPDNAVTLKAIGSQWYWSYEYPDNGDIQFTSNMLKEKDQVAAGQRARTDGDGPRLLAVDNRVVLPVGRPIRLITTATDVIHSWAMPAFWIKLDAIPGRLNEKTFTINKPGLYFGQCSELCGARHAFMPIVVEAVPEAEFAQWVRAKGGTMPSDENAPSTATPAQPGADTIDDTATPAGESGIVTPDVNVIDASANAAVTTQPATGN